MYDDEKLLISEIRLLGHESPNILHSIDFYKYDSLGRLCEKAYYCGPSISEPKSQLFTLHFLGLANYDSTGKKRFWHNTRIERGQKDTYENYIERLFQPEGDGYIEGDHKKYDSEGFLIENYTLGTGLMKMTYILDENGNPIEKTTYIKGKKKLVEKYRYEYFK